MLAVSISLETLAGMTWTTWRQVAHEVERLGFAGLFRSDHLAYELDSDAATLDLVVSLAYLADHTQHMRVGSLVAPLSFRDPVLLAHQAAALDALSDGRLILGVGAGWNEREHCMFGYVLGDVAHRMARFEEGLHVIRQLLRGDGPVTFAGRFFTLHEARLLAQPHQLGGPPLLVGGNGLRRTLPLVARYADIWNALLTDPEDYAVRSLVLDRLLHEAGRRPTDVKRTGTVCAICGRTPAELEARLRWMRQRFDMHTAPLADLLALARSWGAVIGTPDDLVEHFNAYAAVGVEEVMLQWYDPTDIAGLDVLASDVLPRLRV